MKKANNTIYRCSSCGHEEPKWLGRCPECGEWNTLTECALPKGAGASAFERQNGQAATSLPLVAVDPQEGTRIPSGIPELDRVLGGGIMKRSAILIGGEPGVGKSTLLLQMAALVQTKGRVLYVSAEESAGQLRMRADRLGLGSNSIEVCSSSRLEDIETVMEAVKPIIVIIDSIQTVYSTQGGPAPGSVNQMKYCAWELINWVKEHDASLFIVAHVTKDGVISGPKTIEHMVDAVIYFEGMAQGTSGDDCRFIRAAKNRFGSVDEIGIFLMGEKGLQGVDDPGRILLTQRSKLGPDGKALPLPAGVAIAAVLEGSRALLVEVQALTVDAKGAVSRVFSGNVESARVARIAATLEKHLNLRLGDQDLYINIAGGLRVAEVGVELALAAAIYSARSGLSLPQNLAISGELTLAGEARPVRRLAGRLNAAEALGFTRFVCPISEESQQSALKIDYIKDIKTGIKAIFG
ncbi:MAG: DNA repair protein RadA [Spirochaetaceae bacterium]|jgi:DNA repair protein RadA/Sms|nr:DNA repair protein RadA [Spirochaetaceae bacterium]